MLNPWNNAVAQNLEHKAAHSHEIAIVSSVGSVNACFQQSSSSVGSERGLKRTCVICVKGCPVEWEPSSSVPAPYLSPSLPSPKVFIICSSPHHVFSPPHLFVFVMFFFYFRKTHTLADCLPHANTHPRSLPPRFSVFPRVCCFFFFSSWSIIQMSNVFSLLQGANRASIILWRMVVMVGRLRAQCFAPQQNTHSSGLEGRQSTRDQTLALIPAAGFCSSLPLLPDLGHFHVGQQQAASFFFVSNLLFVLASGL